MILLAILRLLVIIPLVFIGLMMPTFTLSDMAHLLLACLGIHGYCTEEDRARLYEFYHTENQGVMMYNHPTFYEHIILVHELKNRFLFVSLSEYLVFPIKQLFARYHILQIRKKSGASQVITDIIKNRKVSEQLLAIAPAGGKCTPDQSKLAEFRTGGFLAKSPVLPVVIKYDNYEPWLPDMNMIKVIWRRLSNPTPIHYRVKVLDPMYPKEDETVEDFKARVKAAMENYLASP